ncbi:uncharacterized protein LOC113236865 [Hyposmocoma kahamanoa]|uniref:uncharacterized protein LOC113236865 n=1 Tax=Hyposmocoma kahamanoa TaxID=1477025 RepID=UPI000E6D7E9D|nr:uncharacterized protein LOC113236865 [Hyposmocoma kahamanoa]XP_026328864.1 uncharacterized protein LOC113236865 [Hyposmocoma kahamanoa]
MLSRVLKPMAAINTRTYKNFGHKRQPEALVTVLWQGFLTFTFIGIGIEWKRIAKIFFGDEHGVEQGPWDAEIPAPTKNSPDPVKTNPGSVENSTQQVGQEPNATDMSVDQKSEKKEKSFIRQK